MSDTPNTTQRDTALAILPLLEYKRRLIMQAIDSITELNRINAASEIAEGVAASLTSEQTT